MARFLLFLFGSYYSTSQEASGIGRNLISTYNQRIKNAKKEQEDITKEYGR